jgi:hypothetical protein
VRDFAEVRVKRRGLEVRVFGAAVAINASVFDTPDVHVRLRTAERMASSVELFFVAQRVRPARRLRSISGQLQVLDTQRLMCRWRSGPDHRSDCRVGAQCLLRGGDLCR